MDIIKVDTQTLVNAAGEFNQQGTQIASLTSEMMTLVKGLAGQWEGETSQVYINQFSQLDDDIQRMSNKITEFVDDLISIANVYNTFEQVNTEAAAGLETDVIS